MASVFGNFISVLWSEKFWLPPNVTWADFQDKPGLRYPHASDLYVSVLLGVLFVVLRSLYEKWVVAPIGSYIGLKAVRRQAVPNPVLESFFKKHGSKYDQLALSGIVKQTDWERRKVERWLRVRNMQDKDSVLMKFGDCAFHLLAYSLAAIGGLYVVWDKPYFFNTKECWRTWPDVNLTNDVYWYYQCELGLYWCLVFRVMTDHRRKDFAENVVHHATTMILEMFSYTLNFVRIGTLVMLVHDVVDPWLAMAKMAKYAKKENLCLGMFITFTVIWLVTRLGVFPFVVLYSSVYEYRADTVSPVYRIFIGLLYTLLVLHLMWTYLILKIAYKNITSGGIIPTQWKVEDVRSDSSADDDDVTDSESPPQEDGNLRVN